MAWDATKLFCRQDVFLYKQQGMRYEAGRGTSNYSGISAMGFLRPFDNSVLDNKITRLHSPAIGKYTPNMESFNYNAACGSRTASFAVLLFLGK